MSRPVDFLFTPFSIGKLALKNRIVMAPMTRSFSPGHVPGENVAAYYRRRAEASVGLILSEGVSPNAVTATGTPDVPNIVTAAAKAGWKKVASDVKAAGGKMGLQIWHEGPYRNPAKSDHPEIPSWSASGFKVAGKPHWPAMTETEIETAIEEFVAAALATKEAGFDCVEFHGAHSYLIDSFFWSETNLRTDKWGGDWKGRTRMSCEIIRRARAKVGPDFPLIIRLSQWKQQDFTFRLAPTPDEMAAWLGPLADAGADVFHCSQRRFWEPEYPELDGPEGLNFAGWAKKLTAKPTITVGSVGLTGEFVAGMGGESSKPASLDGLLARLERDEFDLVGVGRALIVDPDWALKVRDGRHGELTDYTTESLMTLV